MPKATQSSPETSSEVSHKIPHVEILHVRKAAQAKTTLVRKEDIQRTWFLFDAKGKTLGRLACEIARVLMGKHKADYTPSADTGDAVIVINCEQVVVTGNKEAQKIYRDHTGFPGGMNERSYRSIMHKEPSLIIERAVKGMLPKNRLAEHQFRRLRVYKGAEYREQAQNPQVVEI